jgi:hypothetical protein
MSTQQQWTRLMANCLQSRAADGRAGRQQPGRQTDRHYWTFQSTIFCSFPGITVFSKCNCLLDFNCEWACLVLTCTFEALCNSSCLTQISFFDHPGNHDVNYFMGSVQPDQSQRLSPGVVYTVAAAGRSVLLSLSLSHGCGQLKIGPV